MNLNTLANISKIYLLAGGKLFINQSKNCIPFRYSQYCKSCRYNDNFPINIKAIQHLETLNYKHIYSLNSMFVRNFKYIQYSLSNSYIFYKFQSKL